MSLSDVRVLVVDDNATNRRVLSETATRWGMRGVDCRRGPGGACALRGGEDWGGVSRPFVGCPNAQCGYEAVEALREQQFDLVLMDVQMAEMDGFEATTEIRRREQTTGKHQAIVAMTAHAMAGDRARRLDASMDDHL